LTREKSAYQQAQD